MKSYTGLIIGFGIFGGIGMGIGYAAPTPAALKWFGPHKRGLIAGLVVGGYGGAALYISPLGKWLINVFGISGSFIVLGIFFAVVIIVAAQFLSWPPQGYVPPGGMQSAQKTAATTGKDWTAGEMLKTWQFYALVVLFIGSTQSGLLIIANAAGILNTAAAGIPFLAVNAWILASYGGLVNASGRVGTGVYSDKIGRDNAYAINCGISALCLASMPWVIASGNIVLLFIVVGIAYWQYGGGLSLLPSYTADFYGSKHLGVNYGLVFIGWGFGFFMARLAGTIEDITGSLDYAFYLSAAILVVMVLLSRVTKETRAPVKIQQEVNFMQVSITKKEYKTLLEILEIAGWVLSAHKTEKDPRTQKFRDLEQKFFALAADMGYPDFFEYDEDEILFSHGHP
jgi:MFS transporter, OFA family, oxalate/formate antiporter